MKRSVTLVGEERGFMWLTVEYLRDPTDAKSQCWELLPMALDLETTLAIARDGLPHACQHLGARGFHILNNSGAVVAKETWDGEIGTVSLQTCSVH